MTITDFLPESQKEIRERINDTYIDLEYKCLHEEFYENALNNNTSTALIWRQDGKRHEMSYGELRDSSLKVAKMLISKGVKKGELVSVILPKGIEQIIAVLGILSAGAAYVPVGIHHPTERKRKILESGRIQYILTNNDEKKNLSQIEVVNPIAIEDRDNFESLESPVLMPVEATAYVIFTSGTTGMPKGVIITHKSAYNTIYDINRRFEIADKDCIIAVSELDFDLSVYDIFGLLSAGGKLVLLNEENKKEASEWNRLVQDYGVTIWNTVPALFDMFLTVSESEGKSLPFTKVFLSGDWIKINLFSRLKALNADCRFISLGGATEAAIWSNYYEVLDTEENWKSIPYGAPLSNQCLRVVDKNGFDCPDYEGGELWIGGVGVAEGYLNQEVLTKEKFLTEGGTRWYKTGDMARYRSDGILEFLGRMDTQVKINGFRIELEEIEKVLIEYDGISEAVIALAEDNGSKKLVAAIVPELYKKENENQKQQVIQEEYTHTLGDNKLKERIETVERFLLKILVAEDLFINEIDEKTSNVVNIWTDWLIQREVFENHGDKLIQGKRYSEVLSNEEAEQTEVGKQLFKHIDLFKAILKGEKEVVALLEYEDILPEALAMQGTETIFCIEKIIEEIKKKVNIKQRTKVAVLGARTGIAAERLIHRLGESIEITLFDTSAGMLSAAQKRLCSYESHIDYELVTEGFANRKHLYAYDFVVAVNTLHQYLNPMHGILEASILLTTNGSLLAVEYEDLDPMALIVSTLLENGFPDFTMGRSRKNNPLLTKEEWLKAFSVSKFSEVYVSTFSDTSVKYINAKMFGEKNNTSELSIQRYLKEQLPHYMVPEKVEVLPWLLLSPNGKVDRKKIAQLLSSKKVIENTEVRYTGMEKEIAEIWSAFFRCKCIGREQSFFELGGDSLLATRFLTDIKQTYKIEISLRDMFNNPKLCQTAELIKDKLEAVSSMVEGEL